MEASAAGRVPPAGSCPVPARRPAVSARGDSTAPSRRRRAPGRCQPCRSPYSPPLFCGPRTGRAPRSSLQRQLTFGPGSPREVTAVSPRADLVRVPAPAVLVVLHTADEDATGRAGPAVRSASGTAKTAVADQLPCRTVLLSGTGIRCVPSGRPSEPRHQQSLGARAVGELHALGAASRRRSARGTRRRRSGSRSRRRTGRADRPGPGWCCTRRSCWRVSRRSRRSRAPTPGSRSSGASRCAGRAVRPSRHRRAGGCRADFRRRSSGSATPRRSR